MSKGWLVWILGLWLVVTTFLGLGATFTVWNAWIIGVIAAAWGFGRVRATPWQGWLSGVLGFWLILFGFIPALHDGAVLLWNNVLVGLALAVAGFLPGKGQTPGPLP
jgi:hypothetical protein